MFNLFYTLEDLKWGKKIKKIEWLYIMLQPSNPNPCDRYLSDRDYLLHMIPHDQVAVDISKKCNKKVVIRLCMKYLDNLFGLKIEKSR